MKIGIYISDILFRKGGTEAYCSYIIYALQNIYTHPEITIVSEKYEKNKPIEINIASHLSSLFGVPINNKNVNFEPIFADKNNFIKRAFFEHRIKQAYKLIIAGAVIGETQSYATQIKNMILNYQNFIFLHENPTRFEIENYFNNAKIFWHAKGYGVDEEINPYELEHFGITTVEAMSAGCVPVVINKGGQKEIVNNGVNGFMWDTPEELIEKTLYLIQHDDERENMAARAIHRAKNFSLDKFTQNFGNALSRSKQ
jgi:glycosyltransferase involved in cell wall biosynthesis